MSYKLGRLTTPIAMCMPTNASISSLKNCKPQVCWRWDTSSTTLVSIHVRLCHKHADQCRDKNSWKHKGCCGKFSFARLTRWLPQLWQSGSMLLVVTSAQLNTNGIVPLLPFPRVLPSPIAALPSHNPNLPLQHRNLPLQVAKSLSLRREEPQSMPALKTTSKQVFRV